MIIKYKFSLLYLPLNDFLKFLIGYERLVFHNFINDLLYFLIATSDWSHLLLDCLNEFMNKVKVKQPRH